MKITKEEAAEVLRNSGVVKEFDFSIFHPLDHWAFSPYCRSFYGGGRRHLELWWDYQRPGWDRGWEPVDEDDKPT